MMSWIAWLVIGAGVVLGGCGESGADSDVVGKTPSVAEDSDTSPVGTGEEQRGEEEDEEEKIERDGSPHPSPLPSEWEREEEVEDEEALSPRERGEEEEPPPSLRDTSPAGAGEESELRPSENLLVDGGFEDAVNPWYHMADRSSAWVGFEVVDGVGIEGSKGARLVMDSDDESQPKTTAIHGVVQNVVIAEGARVVPGVISGSYFVARWARGTQKQYIQVVVMAERPGNKPGNTNYPSYQVALVLAGIDEPPFAMGNRRFVIGDDVPMEPAVGEWVEFSFDLEEVYREHWGFVPVSGSFRVFFEVRYDGRDEEADGRCEAVVVFDGVYLGDE